MHHVEAHAYHFPWFIVGLLCSCIYFCPDLTISSKVLIMVIDHRCSLIVGHSGLHSVSILSTLLTTVLSRKIDLHVREFVEQIMLIGGFTHRLPVRVVINALLFIDGVHFSIC